MAADARQGPIWMPAPDDVARARITDFARFAGRRIGRGFTDYDDLLRWSVADLAGFWGAIWDYFGVVAEDGGHAVLA
ncbi:MAG: hypothetical protein ACRDVG_03150, partial [Jatrophihabitantaceae bacterium]